MRAREHGNHSMTIGDGVSKYFLGPWAVLALFVIAFVAVYFAVRQVEAFVSLRADFSDIRAKAAFRAAFSILLVWSEVAVLAIILKVCGGNFASLGWGANAPLAGWLAALAVAAFYVRFALNGPMLKGAPMLTDWSAFRILMAVGIAVTAGFGEELLFRGFVMTQARAGGASVIVQILLSALLFGFAHGGWGAMGANFNPGAAIGAIISTSILGALLAIVYVLSSRSLMPVMFAHALIDLIIEPWLMLFALSGGFEKLRG